MFVILLLEIGYNYLGDRESNIACPVYCLKFTIQCNQGLISCIDRGLGLHEYFFFFSFTWKGVLTEHCDNDGTGVKIFNENLLLCE